MHHCSLPFVPLHLCMSAQRSAQCAGRALVTPAHIASWRVGNVTRGAKLACARRATREVWTALVGGPAHCAILCEKHQNAALH